MTHPKEAVEAVARALCTAQRDGLNGDPIRLMGWKEASALIDLIAPMLTARAEADKAAAVEACAAMAFDYVFERLAAVQAREIAFAIRALSPPPAARGQDVAAVEAMRAELEEAKGLLIEAKVQLEEGKIKTRRNRAALIDQFFAKHNPQR